VQDMAAAAAAHDAANQQVELHETKLVPLAKLGFQSSLAAYQTGRDNFESVLSAASAYLRLETDYYRFAAEHIKAVTDFEALKKGARFGAFGAESMPARTMR
jgi:outer membrane protein, heavy metal efflux system